MCIITNEQYINEKNEPRYDQISLLCDLIHLRDLRDLLSRSNLFSYLILSYPIRSWLVRWLSHLISYILSYRIT